MELTVWIDGISRVVCGVTEATTCQEVVRALAKAINKVGRFTLVERWHGKERLVAPSECPISTLQKWGEHAPQVSFVLRYSPLNVTDLGASSGTVLEENKTTTSPIRKALTFTGNSPRLTQNESNSDRPVPPPYSVAVERASRFRGDSMDSSGQSQSSIDSVPVSSSHTPKNLTQQMNSESGMELMRLIAHQLKHLQSLDSRISSLDKSLQSLESAQSGDDVSAATLLSQIALLSSQHAANELEIKQLQSQNNTHSFEEELRRLEQTGSRLEAELSLTTARLSHSDARIRELNEACARLEAENAAEIAKLLRSKATDPADKCLPDEELILAERELTAKRSRLAEMETRLVSMNLNVFSPSGATPSPEVARSTGPLHRPTAGGGGQSKRIVPAAPRQLAETAPSQRNPNGYWV